MSNKLSSLRLLESYLEDLGSLIADSQRLVELEVSSQENDYELRKSLSKIKKFLERNDEGEDYDELVEKYNSYLNDIKTIDISDFQYERNVIQKTVNTKKSVRFNESVEVSQAQPIVRPYRDQVIQEPDSSDTEQLFQGRTDESKDLDGDQQSIESSSNQDIFIQHQQQLLEQDLHLESLASSASRQHGLSLEINQELSDQNILLNDLENQLDSSDRRLRGGERRLNYFAKKAKENGHWMTIIILIVILVLLLIVLK